MKFISPLGRTGALQTGSVKVAVADSDAARFVEVGWLTAALLRGSHAIQINEFWFRVVEMLLGQPQSRSSLHTARCRHDFLS